MAFRVLILWLHLLAAMIWIGGLFFQLLVVRPTLNRATTVREQVRLGLSLEGRFRAILWPAVGVVLLTGLYNVMNLLMATTQAGVRLPTAFVRFLGIKLLLVVLMIGLQAVQQLVLRPRRIAGLQAVQPEAAALPASLVTLQRLSQVFYLLSVILAVVVVLLALLLRA
jgi:copper resistance protein D